MYIHRLDHQPERWILNWWLRTDQFDRHSWIYILIFDSTNSKQQQAKRYIYFSLKWAECDSNKKRRFKGRRYLSSRYSYVPISYASKPFKHCKKRLKAIPSIPSQRLTRNTKIKSISCDKQRPHELRTQTFCDRVMHHLIFVSVWEATKLLSSLVLQ
jgi:hypothetical protein